MLPAAILRQVRRLQLKARRAVEELLGGEYHSVFKGSGIAFDEVRAYLPGDDIRAIDWNVTARMGQPFVKRFVEERERTLLLALDVSGSLRYGTGVQSKRDLAGELAALIAFSAAGNNDRVGLVLFSDRLELYIPPRKGTGHVLRLIREVLHFQGQHRTTSLVQGLDFINRVLKRKTIVFLFSDFLDRGFDQPLRRTGKRHDLICVRLSDPREEELPPVGLVELEDRETGERLLVDTSSDPLRRAYALAAQERSAAIHRMARQARADLIESSTSGDPVQALVRFFRLRRSRRS